MTWRLMWRNVRAATLNAMLQLLVIYRLEFYDLSKPFFKKKVYL